MTYSEYNTRKREIQQAYRDLGDEEDRTNRHFAESIQSAIKRVKGEEEFEITDYKAYQGNPQSLKLKIDRSLITRWDSDVDMWLAVTSRSLIEIYENSPQLQKMINLN